MTRKYMKVGIMSREDFKKRTIGIAKGEYKPRKDEPKIWFESIQSFAQVLSDDNRLLLHIIEERKPKSLRELEVLSGRKKSNLSRTLHTLAGYGIIDLVRKETRELEPHVKANQFSLEIGLPPVCGFCR
ncbi:MAG: transcriptional regulator [Deltaproteobacteria bacterium]|nr:transcriptional regulator [Deltaproteobacteria bacterium]